VLRRPPRGAFLLGGQSPDQTSAPLTSPRSPLQIRPFEATDWPAVWALLEPVFRAGETFPHDPAINEAKAQLAWVEQSHAVMVAVDPARAVVGTYYLRPNSLALGAHAGIRCLQRNGFQVVGTLPGAFRHRQLGYVDALVMVQGLVEGPKP
jgi:hypothetical protein